MHKLLIFIGVAAIALSASARTLSPDEALQRINTSSMAKAPGKDLTQNAKLVYTAQNDGRSQIYIFNATASEGFMVVSADDAAQPLLGYSHTSSFDPDNIPENMRWWLGQYSASIKAASDQGYIAQAHAPARRASIAPLITAKWGQDAPFNQQCPVINNTHAYTGCVATALAQVMYYHRWPLQASGEHNGIDFSQYSFDWDSMTPTYNNQSSQQSKDAVAQLMSVCGLAVDAVYLDGRTGAPSRNMERALIENFGYDADMQYLHRGWYNDAEWENMIYADLIQGLPVLYDGCSSTVGHQFICDGYENGYFHFNWGWNGMSDGYFLLSALDPAHQGIGGGSDGYNSSQWILKGVQKAREGSEFSPMVYTEGTFRTAVSSYGRRTQVKFISRAGNTISYFYNGTGFVLDLQYGAKFTNVSGTQYYVISSKDYLIEPGTGYDSFSLNVSDLPDGVYTVTPVFYDRSTGKCHDIKELLSTQGVLVAELSPSGSTFSLASTGASISASNFTIDTPPYHQTYFKVSATLVSDRDCLASVRPCLYEPGTTNRMIWGGVMSVKLQANEPKEIAYEGYLSQLTTMPIFGETYDMALVDAAFNIISDRIPVKYEQAPAGATRITIDNLELVSAAANDLRVRGSVSCTGGYVTSSIDVYLFPGAGGSNLAKLSSPRLYLSAGESCDFEASGQYTEGTIGAAYQLIPLIGNTLDQRHAIRFILEEPVTETIDRTNILSYDYSTPYSFLTPVNTIARTSNGSWQANEVNIVHGVQFDNPFDFSAAKINYTRTFDYQNWTGLYLPIDLKADEWSAYASQALEFTGASVIDGVTVLTFATVAENAMLKANTPYLILPLSDGEVTLSLFDKMVYATPEKDVCICPEESQYGLFGTYEGLADMREVGAYAVVGDVFCTLEAVSLSPFGVYVKSIEAVDHKPDVLPIEISPIGGISSTLIDPVSNGVMYDLMGRPVSHPTKGLYILNGHKIFIK